MMHFVMCHRELCQRVILQPDTRLLQKVPDVNGKGWAVYPDDEVEQVLLTIRTGLAAEGWGEESLALDCNRDAWFPMSLYPLPMSQQVSDKYREFCPVWAEGQLVALLLRK